MLGISLIDQGYGSGLGKRQDLVAIKAPVFSMAKLVGVDTSLGPEMKSTGEVMGVDRHFVPAMTKCLMAAGLMLAPNGSVLLSVADRDKAEVAPYIRRLAEIGYGLYATEGTAAMIRSMGLSVEMVTKKLREGHPNVVDVIEQGLVQGVLNTVTGGRTTLQDGIAIRRSAAERGLPCFTSIDTFKAAVESLVAPPSRYEILPVIEYLTTGQVETGIAASSGTA
jgi:carbamoyl-phosphate synthase large subunit